MDGGIAGWLYPDQVRWLREHARSRYRILELGAFKGRGTDALCSGSPGHVWTVDHWLGSRPPNGGKADDVTENVERAGGADAVYAEFWENVRHHRNLTVLRMSSAEAWRRCGHLTFDFIFVDASHDYASVYEDVSKWGALLAPGGLISGHDGEYPGVKQAVQELVPGAQEYQTVESVIWYREA